VSFGEILILGSVDWGLPPTVSGPVALSEMMAAQLLERSDVEFVERRRFAAAAARERTGDLAPSGQPPLGTSRGAQLVLMGTWAPAGAGAVADLRLTDAATGEVMKGWRTETDPAPDAVSLARAISGSLLAALAEMDRLPSGGGDMALPASYAPAGVSGSAQQAFFRGLSADDRFDWEGARESYQQALELGGPAFYEARAALGRTARFRLGGTLAESP
jgi:hypothetical protein